MATLDQRTVPFAVPHIDDDDIEAVLRVMHSGWITTGPEVRRFEDAFAQRLGAKHAIALNSATAALHLSLDALGLKPGDEVIVPTITFTASAEVVRYFDAKPVLVDVLPDTLCIDPVAAASAVTEKTRALMPVHLGGHPAEMDALMNLAREHDLAVIEDAAHAFPSVYRGRDAGTIGHLSAFSFYATKTITTGEGGMLVTDDDDMAERARIMSLHGMSRDAWKRYERGGSWRYDVIAPGFKYNMTDMAAALGLSQLNKADWLWQQRRCIAHRYSAAFSSHPALETPTEAGHVQHGWHLYSLRLNLNRLTLNRDEFIDELARGGVFASVHFIPVHTFSYYRSTYDYEDHSFPIATSEFQRMLSLPIYPSMSQDDIQHVVETVLAICDRFAR